RHGHFRSLGDDPQGIPLTEGFIDVSLQSGNDAIDRTCACGVFLAVRRIVVVHELDFVAVEGWFRSVVLCGSRTAYSNSAVAPFANLFLQAEFHIAKLLGVHQPPAPATETDDPLVTGEPPCVPGPVVDPELGQVEHGLEAALITLVGLVLRRRTP